MERGGEDCRVDGKALGKRNHNPLTLLQQPLGIHDREKERLRVPVSVPLPRPGTLAHEPIKRTNASETRGLAHPKLKSHYGTEAVRRGGEQPDRRRLRRQRRVSWPARHGHERWTVIEADALAPGTVRDHDTEVIVMERMLAGVATRRHARTAEPVGVTVAQTAKSTSKS